MEIATEKELKTSELVPDHCVLCGRKVMRIKTKKNPVCDICANGTE
jgi:hypothetical protein